MWILLLGLTSGLVAPSWAGSLQEVKLRSCSYAGVFLIEGNDRYSMTFDEAMNICDSLGTQLANKEQLSKAYEMGMETCRYGWEYSGNTTILRKEPHDLCAKNMTGVLSFLPIAATYDAYCYDPQDQSTAKNCTFEIRKPYSNVSDIIGDSESRDSNDNENFSTTVVPVELHSYSTVIDAIEKMKPTPSSFPHKHDKLEDTLNQTTQSSTEPTKDEIYDHLPDIEEITTITSTLESPGSGMGEIYTTISESTSEDPKSIPEVNGKVEDNISETNAIEYDKRNTDDTDHKGRKIAPGAKEEMEEEPGSDWLVILLVILAVLAIILVAALVLNRNRWCGRSQTLMITSKSSNEGNGAAASAASPQDQEREQEMVTLMNKEKVQENGNTEEFTVITLEESPEKNQQA